jgi:hypothetical protein
MERLHNLYAIQGERTRMNLLERQLDLYRSIQSYCPSSAERYAVLVNDPNYLERPETRKKYFHQRNYGNG